MKIITVANQKGGVGKSTTAAALGAGLEKCGKSVIFIDLDPQINLTTSFGASSGGVSIYEVLTGRVDINDSIMKIDNKNIVIGNRILSNADTEFNLPGREYKLQKALKKLKSEYDYVIIDTPPALGMLTVNALTASDYVIIPAEADTSSLQGVTQLKETIDAVKEYCNSNLKILGIVLTRYSKTVLSRDLAETFSDMAKDFETIVYKTPIRECIAIKEAKAQQEDIFKYAPKSNAANDYMELTKDFLKEVEKVG